MNGISTRQPEREGLLYLLEHDGSRCLVESLLETVPDFFWSRVHCGDTRNYWFSTVHLNITDCCTILSNPIIMSLNRFGCSGARSGSGWGCELKSRPGDQARNVCPEFLSHQELRHPGGPGEPVRVIKDWDRVKSGLGRYIWWKAGKSIISDQRYMKMQGKIKENAKAFKSKDSFYASLSRGLNLRQ